MSDPLEDLSAVAAADQRAQTRDEKRGAMTVFTCPECGGSLWQVDETNALRFRCHVGHSFHADALLSGQSEVLEAALWTAVRIFRDKSVLSRQVAARERSRGNEATAHRLEEQAEQNERYAALIQEYIPGTAPPRGPAGGETKE